MIKNRESMRWVSMVPSWTETLIECGANVVGRTRYCIHPADRVREIPAVGGTKEVDFAHLTQVKPDILLLDREENPQAMAERVTLAMHVSHVRSIADLPTELLALTQIALSCQQPELAERLQSVSVRWQKVIDEAGQKQFAFTWQAFPGVIDWLVNPPDRDTKVANDPSRVVYVIWRKPWMCAAEGTFISSVLKSLGVTEGRVYSPPFRNLYPTFEMEALPDHSVVLFSSEPYPFVKKRDEILTELGELATRKSLSLALVDGESFSWFGTRSLKFLEGAFLSSAVTSSVLSSGTRP